MTFTPLGPGVVLGGLFEFLLLVLEPRPGIEGAFNMASISLLKLLPPSSLLVSGDWGK